MKKIPIILYFLLYAVLNSCTKTNEAATNSFTSSGYNNLFYNPVTTFGVLLAGKDLTATESSMNRNGIELVRQSIFYSINTSSKSIDSYLKDGYNVEINFNYQATSTAKPWPTDTAMIRRKAESFFSYYKKWLSQIPVVVCENEWDFSKFHIGPIQNYLNELTIVVQVGHKYGFKVTDGGITDGKIRMFYKGYVNIDTFLSGIKKIPVDFINFHWYVANDQTKDYNLRDVVNNYLQATGKSKAMTNEFGLKSNSMTLWTNEVNALKGFVYYGIAYSGTNDPNGAITLSDAMLNMLR